MMHIAPFVVLVMIALVGTIGNLLIIGAVCIYKRLRVRGHVFIVNLAIADLLVTSYIMPVGLATSQHEKNPFGETMCDLNAFLILTSCGVSTQTLMAIALERYFHICRTNLYRKIFTKKLVTFYVVFIWLYTAAWTCQGFTSWTKYKYSATIYMCILDGQESLSYDICLALLGMILPIVVVTVCYVLIFRTARGGRKALEAHRKRLDSFQSTSSNGNNNNGTSSLSLVASKLEKQQRKNQREHRFIVTLFSIVIIFLVCWVPATVTLMLSGVWMTMPALLWPTAMWLAFCNSSMNSIVYGVMNKHFREGYMELMDCVLCCRRFKCNTCGVSGGSDDESLNSQSRLAANHSRPTNGPPQNFRFPVSNDLKGYGSRIANPLYQEIPGRIPSGEANGDVLRHRLTAAASTSSYNDAADPQSGENNYMSFINTGDIWHYPKPQEADYIYGAFSSGNSSIITIESTLSEDSDIDDIYSRRYRTVSDSQLELTRNQQYRSRSDMSGSDISRDIDNLYDSIGNVHRGSRVKSQVKTTNIVGLRKGDISPIYEIPIPEGEGNIILPTQVKRTPVFKRRVETKFSPAEINGSQGSNGREETRL